MLHICIQFYGREHKPPVPVDVVSPESPSIQGASTLSCQGTSTPLCNSTDNSNTSSLPLRRCRVRVVNIDDESRDAPVDETSTSHISQLFRLSYVLCFCHFRFLVFLVDFCEESTSHLIQSFIV